MDFYHSVIYMYVFNTEWFMWIVVSVVLAVNILVPVFIWYYFKGRSIIQRYKSMKQQGKR
ncbi:hypothetical protein [Paenibacillus aestuarii]|uniref:Uncharacterized protein n=1 Tax=Paenibacillus aestuarii TaxID=516965 RepID=A0ABW0K1I1_9BACL|nr:hypothetical protein [Paenibacillus aestuarii]